MPPYVARHRHVWGGRTMATGVNNYDRRENWAPPPRPEWVQRVNDECSGLDIRSVVPLDEQSLLDTARHNTGLSDFAEDGWREHFRVLLEAIDKEARLHFIGRVLTRSDFLIYLQARLRIVDWYARHPEVNDEKIETPILILGFGRSGTTILFEILAQDPQFRVVKKWEALFPCPPPETATYLADPRIGLAEKISSFSENIIPEFKSMHKLGGNLPVESVEFVYLTFLSEVFPIAFQVPSYARYLARQDLRYTFGWHKKVLKLLQSRHAGRHWLLKGPSHLPYLPELLSTYPDAKIVFTHRDPIVSADSVVSMQGTLYWWRTNHPWGDGTVENWVPAGERARLWDGIIDQMDSGAIARQNITNFQYDDFMRDPMASIRRIYADLGLTLQCGVEERMRAYLAARPQEQFGKHRYNTSPESVIAAERRVYRRYQEYFGVPNEI
jgi:hypothetical protein